MKFRCWRPWQDIRRALDIEVSSDSCTPERDAAENFARLELLSDKMADLIPVVVSGPDGKLSTWDVYVHLDPTFTPVRTDIADEPDNADLLDHADDCECTFCVHLDTGERLR